jgi:hypothetical protein
MAGAQNATTFQTCSLEGEEMPGLRKAALAALAAASLGSSLWLAPAAMAAEDATWNGKYLVTLSTNRKTGTSMAASQPEPPQLVSYTFSSSCSTGECIATVTDAPPPKNESIPRPIEYRWNGSQWIQEMTWKWDCLLPDGTTEYDPAQSITAFKPGPNGILEGTFHTDISSGACQGTVDVPVSATPG